MSLENSKFINGPTEAFKVGPDHRAPVASPTEVKGSAKRLVAKDHGPLTSTMPPMTDWMPTNDLDLGFDIDNIFADHLVEGEPVPGFAFEPHEPAVDQVWSVSGRGQSLFKNDEPMASVDPLLLHTVVIDQGPDLVKMIMDDTLQPDDPEFQEFVRVNPGNDGGHGHDDKPQTTDDTVPHTGDTTQLTCDPSPEQTIASPKRTSMRTRGRPRKPKAFVEAPRRQRGRPPTASSVASAQNLHLYDSRSSSMSADEIRDVKYKRMRELNNAASKRCRLHRKAKAMGLEVEEQRLRVANASLKIKVGCLERQVAGLKAAFLDRVRNDSMLANLETLL